MEPEDPLSYTFDEKKVLSAEDQGIYKKFFKLYDKNGDRTMDQAEFKQIMIDMGYRQITDDKVQEMLKEQDQNSDGVISWGEFKAMMVKLKSSDAAKFGELKDSAMG
jgi:Ca2+-binding EF-hand superfamily protein